MLMSRFLGFFLFFFLFFFSSLLPPFCSFIPLPFFLSFSLLISYASLGSHDRIPEYKVHTVVLLSSIPVGRWTFCSDFRNQCPKSFNTYHGISLKNIMLLTNYETKTWGCKQYYAIMLPVVRMDKKNLQILKKIRTMVTIWGRV